MNCTVHRTVKVVFKKFSILMKTFHSGMQLQCWSVRAFIAKVHIENFFENFYSGFYRLLRGTTRGNTPRVWNLFRRWLLPIGRVDWTPQLFALDCYRSAGSRGRKLLQEAAAASAQRTLEDDAAARSQAAVAAAQVGCAAAAAATQAAWGRSQTLQNQQPHKRSGS